MTLTLVFGCRSAEQSRYDAPNSAIFHLGYIEIAMAKVWPADSIAIVPPGPCSHHGVWNMQGRPSLAN